MSKASGFLKEFRDFAVKGNAMDLAIGVIIGAAFGKIIDSVVNDLVMPIVSFILGGDVNFDNLFLVLRQPEGYSGVLTSDALKEAAAVVFAWGRYLTVLIGRARGGKEGESTCGDRWARSR